MTRNEAIELAVNIMSPGNTDVGYRYNVGNDIDVWVALGMLKLEEVETSPTDEENLKEAIVRAGWPAKTAREILQIISWSGLKLVKK